MLLLLLRQMMNLNHVGISLKLLVCTKLFFLGFFPSIFVFLLENLVKSLTDSDPQKNLLTLATKLAELQEQSRTNQSKITELEKRSAVLMRERDQVLMENSRVTAAKTKLESLCRELHKHNQQIRVNKFESILFVIQVSFQEESVQRQQEDETKRRELATKFQVDDILFFRYFH